MRGRKGEGERARARGREREGERVWARGREGECVTRRAHGFSDAFSSKARGVGEAPRRHVIKDVPQGCKPAPTVAETS